MFEHWQEKYTEKELNNIIKKYIPNFAAIRRYFIEYGFMDRTKDCNQYWIKAGDEKMDINETNYKKFLKQNYKNLKTEAGIYMIKNKINGKLQIITTYNVKTINGKIAGLNLGSTNSKFKNLQQEWSAYGEDSFEITILEILKDNITDKKEALKKLKEHWTSKLDPDGTKKYDF